MLFLYTLKFNLFTETTIPNIQQQQDVSNNEIKDLLLGIQQSIIGLRQDISNMQLSKTETPMTTIEKAAELTQVEISLYKKAEMTTKPEYEKMGITKEFLDNIKLKPRRNFVIDLLLKLFKNEELYGKSATGQKAPASKGGHETLPIDQKENHSLKVQEIYIKILKN